MSESIFPDADRVVWCQTCERMVYSLGDHTCMQIWYAMSLKDYEFFSPGGGIPLEGAWEEYHAHTAEEAAALWAANVVWANGVEPDFLPYECVLRRGKKGQRRYHMRVEVQFKPVFIARRTN